MDLLANLRHSADAALRAAQMFADQPPDQPPDHPPEHEIDVGLVDAGIAVLTELISRMEGLRLRMLRQRGIVDRAVLSGELGLSRGATSQIVKAIERLGGLAALHAAVEAGHVSMSKAHMIADAVSSTQRHAAAVRDEASLVELAALPGAQLARALDRWARTADEDSGDDTATDLYGKRSFDTSKRASGMTEVSAHLDPETAEVVITAIDARLKAEWDHETEAEHGARTPTQRRADALKGICNDWLNGTLTGDGNGQTMRSRPHVSVIVDLKTLTDGVGVAVTERGTILSPEAARRICCDAGISRIITDGPSQLIDIGREQRTFQHGARKALVLRDQGCRFPACNAPPSWCEGHHIQHWTNNGVTEQANGVLLCPTHHRHLHEGGWTISGHPDAVLTFTSPTGLALSSSPGGYTSCRRNAA